MKKTNEKTNGGKYENFCDRQTEGADYIGHGLLYLYLYLQDGKLFDAVYLREEKRQILAMQLNGFT